MNIYDFDYANEIREILLDELNSLEQIKLELNWDCYIINGMNNITNDQWDICFEAFHKLEPETRNILRNCAVNHLIADGCEEVGSSDTNHELFSMWKISGRNWMQALQDEFEAFAQTA